MLTYLDAVVDDIRVFHRVDEPLDLPSPRFFGMAKWLPDRGGAVTAVHARENAAGREVWTAPSSIAGDEQSGSWPAQVAEGTATDVAALAAMSQNGSGFPGVGYSGG